MNAVESGVECTEITHKMFPKLSIASRDENVKCIFLNNTKAKARAVYQKINYELLFL
jgi:hypothetical protein